MRYSDSLFKKILKRKRRRRRTISFGQKELARSAGTMTRRIFSNENIQSALDEYAFKLVRGRKRKIKKERKRWAKEARAGHQVRNQNPRTRSNKIILQLSPPPPLYTFHKLLIPYQILLCSTIYSSEWLTRRIHGRNGQRALRSWCIHQIPPLMLARCLLRFFSLGCTLSLSLIENKLFWKERERRKKEIYISIS